MIAIAKPTLTKTLTVFSISATMLLTGCATHYTFDSNLDQDNINEYFSPAQVTIYNEENELPQPYRYTGLVEGQDCQSKPHHAAPDKINARTEARKLASKMGANAIIFTSCALVFDKSSDKNNNLIDSNTNDAQQCHSLIVCYGKSFATKNSEE